MSETSLRTYCSAADPQHTGEFLKAMESKGYYAFYEFISEIKDALKKYGDADKEKIGQLLDRLQTDFPAPERYSPSWTGLWDELKGIYEAKNQILSEVQPDQREGEWQVQLDNPYTTEQAACYPGLLFIDAAYLFAYFRQGLKPNEILRLQKVTHVKIVTPER